MLNLAGPEFDFGQRPLRRAAGMRAPAARARTRISTTGLESCAREKLAQIKGAYDEFSGSTAYWQALEKEVMETALPQYVEPARIITALERSPWTSSAAATSRRASPSPSAA